MPGHKRHARTKRTRHEHWYSRPAQLLPLRRGTLAQRSADQLRRRIVLGDLRPGARIESSRALAKELKVSLPVVREAMAELRAIGLVEIRQGVGTFVTRRPRAAPPARAAKRRASRREVHELRAGLEPLAAAKAATRPGPVRLRGVRLALHERERVRHSGDATAFTNADLELHRCVAQAAGNVVAVAVQGIAAKSLWPDLAARAGSLAPDPRLAELHARLVDAIEAGRSATAGRVARAIAEIEARAP
jgi:DNA-binding FadR family transcriptional regulator